MFFFAAIALSSALAAEPAATPIPRIHVAAQAAVTAEAFEESGSTVSINVVPLVVEGALTDRVGLRGVSIVNLQVSGPDTGLSHRGAGLTVPGVIDAEVLEGGPDVRKHQ